MENYCFYLKRTKNIMKTFKDYLEDAFTKHVFKTSGEKLSRNKLSLYEQLEKYKDNKNIYISFRSVDKIGINPKSIYKNPIGIYAFPLKSIWENFDHINKQIKIPNFGNNPFLYVIESVGNGIEDISVYTEEQLKNDFNKLKNSEFLNRFKSEDFDKIFKDSLTESWVKSYGGRLWYITRILAENFKDKKSNIVWNFIFNKILNYNFICDYSGTGILGRHEPKQAVFFNTKCFKVIDKLYIKENL